MYSNGVVQVKLGAVDATVHQGKAAEYGVQGYPTIKFFSEGKKTRKSAEDYTGGRTASEIVNWALDKLAENVPPPQIKQVFILQIKPSQFSL
jgi:protein disulfide-isomerase A6